MQRSADHVAVAVGALSHLRPALEVAMTPMSLREKAQKACACVVDWGKCSRCLRIERLLTDAVAEADQHSADMRRLLISAAQWYDDTGVKEAFLRATGTFMEPAWYRAAKSLRTPEPR